MYSSIPSPSRSPPCNLEIHLVQGSSVQLPFAYQIYPTEIPVLELHAG